jgi:hypothetical protein
MDLFAEYRMASQSSQESSYDLTTSGLGVRGYVSPMLSLGASVHQEQRDSLRGGKLDRALSRFLTLDASWLPSDLWNLSMGVSIARTTDSQQSLSISPHFDARWDVDPATTLTLQYRLLRTDQEDGVLASSTTGALLTGRLIRRLPNEGILEVSYDFNRATSSVFAWERVLELRYSRSY